MPNCNLVRTRNGSVRLSPHTVKRHMIAVLFLLPAIIAFIVIRYVPLIQCIWYSFHNYSIVDPPGNFVGFSNFVKVLKSDLFWQYFKNTLILFGYSVIFGFFTPIIQALLLNEVKRGKGVLRYLYILPAGMPAIANITIWRYIWNPDWGLANKLMDILGLSHQQWLQSAEWVKFCIRFPSLVGGGLGLLIYVTAINNISSDIYEAAAIDGATAWQRIWRITLPSIRGTIATQFLFLISNSLLAFDDVFQLTKGGPGYSSTTMVIGLYKKAFAEQQFGIAMAMSVMVFLFGLTFSAITFRAQTRKES